MHKIIFAGLLLFPVVSHGLFFRCVVDGVISFQDRPCQHGVGGRIELDISPPISVVKAPVQHSNRDKTPLSSKKRKSKLSKTRRQKQVLQRRCERAKVRYKRHLSLMRAGYSHKRSNRMGEKARSLKAEINKRCL